MVISVEDKEELLEKQEIEDEESDLEEQRFRKQVKDYGLCVGILLSLMCCSIVIYPFLTYLNLFYCPTNINRGFPPCWATDTYWDSLYKTFFNTSMVIILLVVFIGMGAAILFIFYVLGCFILSLLCHLSLYIRIGINPKYDINESYAKKYIYWFEKTFECDKHRRRN